MDFSELISKDKLEWRLPIRVCSIGSMSTGKTTWVLNFVKHIDKFISNCDEKIEIVLVSDNHDTMKNLKGICEEKRFAFLHYKSLPKMMLEPFETVADLSKQIIIILEDYMPLIQNSDQNILKIFLKNSRHKNIRSDDKMVVCYNFAFVVLWPLRMIYTFLMEGQPVEKIHLSKIINNHH